MDDLTEFQQRACAAAMVKILTGSKHFNVCDLDAIAETMGRKSALAGRDYAALRAVHCMDWANMGPDLARQVREKCFELLGLPPQTVEMVQPERKAEAREEPAKRLRLAWWK